MAWEKIMDLAKIKDWWQKPELQGNFSAPIAGRITWLISECDRLTAQLSTVEGERAELKKGAESLYPAKCPITRRDFFMVMEHPDLGDVPTYGGPFDSYTIPEMDGDADQPFHERELCCERFDHDAGAWVDGTECIPLRVINEQVLYQLEDRAEKAESELLQVKGERDRYRALLERVSDAVGMPSCHCEEAWELIRAALHPTTEAPK